MEEEQPASRLALKEAAAAITDKHATTTLPNIAASKPSEEEITARVSAIRSTKSSPRILTELNKQRDSTTTWCSESDCHVFR